MVVTVTQTLGETLRVAIEAAIGIAAQLKRDVVLVTFVSLDLVVSSEDTYEVLRDRVWAHLRTDFPVAFKEEGKHES